MNNPMLEAKNIHKTYSHASRPLNVLKGVDVTVGEGEVLAIVGPSGAGKSTLLHILGGLDRPTEGTVAFEGTDIYTMRNARLARFRNQQVGFIFQFYHLLPEFSALENVVLPAMIRDDTASVESLEAHGLELLSRVGLAGRVRHKPHELSGGEQQRVAIARALVNSPRIIFCDEPTGNLDSSSGEAVMNLLWELNTSHRQALVLVTHDETLSARAHRVIHLHDGTVQKS